ncbi:hypothetical protein Gpo141_00000283 [Globisporangium polare]
MLAIKEALQLDPESLMLQTQQVLVHSHLHASTCDEIKNSYRALVRRHHPDKNRNAAAGEEIKCITEAYRVLSNPAQRRHYDTSLRVKRQYP